MHYECGDDYRDEYRDECVMNVVTNVKVTWVSIRQRTRFQRNMCYYRIRCAGFKSLKFRSSVFHLQLVVTLTCTTDNLYFDISLENPCNAQLIFFVRNHVIEIIINKNKVISFYLWQRLELFVKLGSQLLQRPLHVDIHVAKFVKQAALIRTNQVHLHFTISTT